MGHTLHDVLQAFASVSVGGPVLVVLVALLLTRELLLVWPEGRRPGPVVRGLDRLARVAVRPLAVVVGLILLVKVLL